MFVHAHTKAIDIEHFATLQLVTLHRHVRKQQSAGLTSLRHLQLRCPCFLDGLQVKFLGPLCCQSFLHPVVLMKVTCDSLVAKRIDHIGTSLF